MASIGKSFTPTYHHTPYPGIDPTRPELSAKDKVVVITGGGQGIGRATARAFAQANAYALILTGRNKDTLLETKVQVEKISPNTQVRATVGDVTNAKAVDAIFDSAKEEFGRVDVLISNAGYLPRSVGVSEQDPEDFWRSFEINTKGAFNVVRAFLRVASPNATLVNVSTAAAHMAFPGQQGYASSKAAVLNFFEHVQQQNESVRVFSIHPGVVESAMSVKAGFPGEDDENLPAHFQVWLTTPEADFLKGKMVWANWDVEELKARKNEVIDGRLLSISLKGWEPIYQ